MILNKIKKTNEFAYFAFRNTKFLIGLSVFIFFVLLALLGPLFVYKGDPTDFIAVPHMPPNLENLLGTTGFGQDVFAQIVEGTKNMLLVGLLAGAIGTVLGLLIGFLSGYKGGMFDEFLMMFTNVIMVMPVFALLIILAGYLTYRGIVLESILIGFINWPWVARAVRAQTLSLKNREFIELSKISGVRSLKIIATDLAPNMLSYIVMAFILQLSGAIMYAASLDFIGLGPTDSISLGVMMNIAVKQGALIIGNWWWAIPPGLVIMLLVSSLFFMNTGLDEVFNPKLRKL